MTEEEELNEKIDLIEEDLLALIQDEGLTDSRLEQFGVNILALWGVKSVGFIREEVRSALLDLKKRDKYGMALTWALGAFTPAAQIDKLKDRRLLLKEEVKDFDVSEDTLRRWERRAMKPLARMLIEQSMNKGDTAWSYQSYAERNGTPDEKIDALKTYFDNKIDELRSTAEEARIQSASAKRQVAKLREEVDELKARGKQK